jgi:hypothetical protein
MSEGIHFDITANDKTAGAISSTVSGLEKLSKASKEVGQGVGSVDKRFAEFSRNSTTRANSFLAYEKQKAAALKETARLDMQSRRQWFASAQMQERAMQEMNKAMAKRNATLLPGLEKRYAGIAEKVSTWKAANAGLLTTLGGVAAGVGVAAVGFQQFYKFSEQGAQIQATKKRFDNLSVSIGTTGDVLTKDLRSATRGLYSDMQNIELANNLVGLGFARTKDEAVRLAKVSSGLGMDMNQLALTLANKTTMRFDQLGVRLEGFKERMADLQKSGLSKDDAFQEAFIQQAEAQLKLVGNTADTAAGSFMQAKSAWQNMIDAFRQSQGGAMTGINKSSANLFQNIADAQQAKNAGTVRYNDWKSIAAQLGVDATQKVYGGNRRMVDAMSDRGKAIMTEIDRYNAMGAAYGGNFVRTTPSEFKDRMATDKNAMTEEQMGSLLQGGLKLTDMNEKFAEVNYKVNGSLEEQTKILEELREKGYAETSQKIQDQIAVVNDLRVQSVQATQAQADAQEQYALKMLEVAGASNEQMLQFAVASGQMSQGAANQQMAQEKLAESVVNGSVSVNAYAADIAYLMEKVKGMDGASANAYIDVWIREHGDAAMLATVTAEAQTQTGGTAGQHGGAIGDDASYATGGQLGSGWALVGDRPGGIFVPGVSELVSPTGYVYDSKTSEMLLKSGFVGGTRSLALSGDLMGVGGGSVTKRPSPKVSTANRAGSRGGGVSLSSLALASSEATQEQQAQQQAQAMAQMQDEFTAAMRIQQNTLNNKLDELIGVMTGANPRAIGAEVGYQLAKAS